MSFEIYKTLVASTAHIEPSDFRVLEDNPEAFIIYDHYHGTKIYIHEEILNDISRFSLSEGLRLLILFAASHNCRFLDLDADGPVYDDFPTNDW